MTRLAGFLEEFLAGSIDPPLRPAWCDEPIITLISTPLCEVSVKRVLMLRQTGKRAAEASVAAFAKALSHSLRHFGVSCAVFLRGDLAQSGPELHQQTKTNRPHFLSFSFFLCPRLSVSLFISIGLIVLISLHCSSPSLNQQAAILAGFCAHSSPLRKQW